MPKSAKPCHNAPHEFPEPDDYASGLKPNQQRAVIALLEAPSIAAAARRTGIGLRTLQRWIHEDPDFQDELRKLRGQHLAQAATRLQSTATQAVQTLLDLLASKDHIETGRATLVRTALDFAFRAGSYTDLADRLQIIEEEARRQNETGSRNKPSHQNRFADGPVEVA